MSGLTTSLTTSPRSRCRTLRRGATLIDVAVGAALLSLVLIPALSLMGQSSQLLQRMDRQDQLLFEAERLMEQTKVDLCDPTQFASTRGTLEAIVTGNETRSMRSQVSIQDSLVLNLVTLNVVVWEDGNNNSSLDAGELSQSLRTQWSQP
ncbi:putative transmembrane protein [Rhodopirellula islandica]|uniref:Transmembrane protein n=1 Tax=Rhodopirellula islandica TaxID=595434 RepID=A0A0J1BBD7_RHOIS|nr:hypothetical protein [Rhodopirellula islandica]KLU03947.1 putative transmembrane protein [Rhodopirellula islandica]